MHNISFLLENKMLWHLKPEPLDDDNYYKRMDSLQQLLSEGPETPLISRCKPRDQLVLCYVLATSLLYLYPGSWFPTELDSSMVYFVRPVSAIWTPVLAFPYISVELREQTTEKSPLDYWQGHQHPMILDLGIIFLEIVTGRRFPKSAATTPSDQSNENYAEAMRLLKSLRNRRHGTSCLTSSMGEAIRACLKLEPPPDFPSNRLTDEDLIRRYILSCIVSPLAQELKDGHKVSLDDLHTTLVSEWENDNAYGFNGTQNLSHQSADSPGRCLTVDESGTMPPALVAT
jgi:hypothetical protein